MGAALHVATLKLRFCENDQTTAAVFDRSLERVNLIDFTLCILYLRSLLGVF